MKITWYGHSCFRLEIPADTDKGKVEILIDPFLTGNPKATITPEEAAMAEHSRRMLVWGTPDRVRSRLLELAERLEVDELIVTTHIAAHEERMRSYALLAEAFA